MIRRNSESKGEVRSLSQASARTRRALVSLAILGLAAVGCGAFRAASPAKATGANQQLRSSTRAASSAMIPIANSDSGITGKIVIKPVCPVESNPPRPECAPKPYQATVTVKTSDGSQKVAEFTSDTNGKFKIALDPGDYLLIPTNGPVYPRAAAQSVTVESGKFREVTITYDSGIR